MLLLEDEKFGEGFISEASTTVVPTPPARVTPSTVSNKGIFHCLHVLFLSLDSDVTRLLLR